MDSANISSAILAALPEIILAVGAMAMLMTGVFIKNSGAASLAVSRFALITLSVALASIYFVPQLKTDYFNDLFLIDGFALFSKIVIIFSAAIVLMMSISYLDDKANNIGFEYSIIVILSVVGMLIMVSANDLMTLYLGLELQSLSLYVLAAMRRTDRYSSEAAIKYFVLGALASGILLYGASLVYGFLGSTNFNNISQVLASHEQLPKAVIVGLVLVATGLCFKISAAPFHMWTPDVYEGVPTPVTAFFAIVPKLAAMSLIIRIFVEIFHEFSAVWQQVIIAISVMSMFVGAFGGLWQGNIKRLLAYSSIGHMGYALLGVCANTELGVQSVLAYFIIYILNSIAIFSVILSTRVRQGIDENMVEKIDHFKGLSRSHPVIAALFTLMLVSMIGLPFPPYPGFFGKFFVFSAAISANLYILAVLGMVASVIAAYYYLRIIKLMYFDTLEENIRVEVRLDPLNAFVTVLALIGSAAVFLYPSLILDIAGKAAGSLF